MAIVENFRKLMKSLILYSKVSGVEMWTAPGQFRPASYYVSFHIIVYFVSTVFTLQKYRNDPIHMMKVLITLGTAVQLYIKFFVCHSKAYDIKLFADKIEKDVLEHYQNGTAEETSVLKRVDRILTFIFRFVSTLIISVVLGFALYPLFIYLTSGTVIPLFLYELPYFDGATTAGYIVTLLFQLNLLVIGAVGTILKICFYVLYAMYAMARADIFIAHLNELEDILNDQAKQNKNGRKIHEKWLQCVYDHQETTSFLSMLQNIFGLMCLSQVTTAVLSICNGLLLAVLTDWYPVYLYLLALFIELSVSFVIGHLIELKIDAMYSRIISIPWYRFSVKKQRDFGFLLCKQQGPMMLTAYGFHSMNFEAYMRVLKGLYQFFIVLLQYFG